MPRWTPSITASFTCNSWHLSQLHLRTLRNILNRCPSHTLHERGRWTDFSSADILVTLSMWQVPATTWVLTTWGSQALHCSGFARPPLPAEQKLDQTDRNQSFNVAKQPGESEDQCQVVNLREVRKMSQSHSCLPTTCTESCKDY